MGYADRKRGKYTAKWGVQMVGMILGARPNGMKDSTDTGGAKRMAVDMKEMIAEAAGKLLEEKKVKKLTVKDIVEECQITRQAFYYHFEDIPDLLRWKAGLEADQLLEECRAQGSQEASLRYFFVFAINLLPHVKKGMETNYRKEIEEILIQNMYRLFGQIVEEDNLYQSCSRTELKFLLRYHSQAILGILREWTDEDTKNLDQIVHEVYLIMTGGILPIPPQNTDK